MQKRILVIDDQEDVRELIGLSLKKLTSWEALAAASGAEGVAIAETEKPDAILLDMLMPGMDGAATLALLQQRHTTRGIPVIFLTGRPEMADAEPAGVAGVILKPFDLFALPKRIAQILGWETAAPAAGAQSP